MDPISQNTLAFLDVCGIEAEGHRKVILMKVQKALQNSPHAQRFLKLPQVTFHSGPVADKVYGICLAQIQKIFPDEEKIEFETANEKEKLILPSYFKGLLEKDYSSLIKDPEKAERMRELTLKNQFRNITKEAATLYLATRFGKKHLESIDDVSKETVLETVEKAYATSYLNDSILAVIKETIQKLDPSKRSDVSYLCDLVSALKTRLDVKPEVSLFVKKSLSCAKKYTLFVRFKKWLNRFLPIFICNALNLLPKQDLHDLYDLHDLIRLLSRMGGGVLGFEFPFALPNRKEVLFSLTPIKDRIPILDCSEFKTLSKSEIAFIAQFKNLKELILNAHIELSEEGKEALKKIRIIYLKEEETPPNIEPAQGNAIKAEAPANASASKDGAGASAHADAKGEAPQSIQAPPAAGA